MSENSFRNSQPFLINHTVGEPKTNIFKNQFVNTEGPKVVELNSPFQNTAIISENEGLNP